MSQLTELHGWGRNPRRLTQIISPTNIRNLEEKVRNSSVRGILATGLQRSYGDSTLNSGGITVSTSAFNWHLIDEVTGIAIAGAGLSIRQLENAALAKDFFPPIVPGTGFVTLGGAVAADIHGKSHHLTGSFSSAVRRLRVLHADGTIRDLYPEGQTSKYFWATVGGLGLTGIIIEIELQL
jgi:decaprenylphospho-beta-D-ribofuranose 2-oxidase